MKHLGYCTLSNGIGKYFLPFCLLALVLFKPSNGQAQTTSPSPEYNVFSILSDPSYDYQDVVGLLEPYFVQYPDAPGIKTYNRWKAFWSTRLDVNGSLKTAYEYNMAGDFTTCQNTGNSSWFSIGPSNIPTPVAGTASSPGTGIVVPLTISPYDAEGQTILVGSNSGGMYKTTNGGTTWVNVTDGMHKPGLGIWDIEYSPNGSGTKLYASTGINSYGRGYGIGIIESNDGGTTWSQMTGLAPQPNEYMQVPQILVRNNGGNDQLIASVEKSNGFVILERKIMKADYPFTQWTTLYTFNVSAGESVGKLISPYGQPNRIFSAGKTLIKSTDGGTTFSNITTQVEQSGYTIANTNIALRKGYANEMYLLVLYMNSSNGKYSRIFKSTDYGDTWTPLANLVSSSTLYLGAGQMSLAVSGKPNGDIYIGGIANVYKTTDGGNTFLTMASNVTTSWPNGYYVHDDHRNFAIVENSQGTEFIWSANDGGMTVSTNAGSSWTYKNSGLDIAQFYGFDISRDGKFLLGGAQDEGAVLYKFDTGEWHACTRVGDAYKSVIAQDGSGKALIFTNGGNNRMYRANQLANGSFSGLSSYVPTLEGFPVGPNRPVAVDDAGNVYVAGRNLFKTSDFGTTWTQMSNLSLPQGEQTVGAIGISPVDSRFIYMSNRLPDWSHNPPQNKFFRTTNGGTTWTDLSATMTINGFNPLIFFEITAIAVSDKNPNVVYVTFSNFGDVNWGAPPRRVWKSNDGGATWEDYSQGLPFFPSSTIIYERGSNDRVYVGTDVGVYYRENGWTEWRCFSDNLPVAIVSDLKIDYCKRRLYASLFGRGMWYSDIPAATDNADALDPATERITVASNQTWGNRNVYTDVLVTTGNKLTVMGTVYMHNLQKIAVEPGAILEVKEGRITNGCSTPWHEIQLWGNSSQPQTAGVGGFYPQARLILNNATIENSHNGVTTWKPNNWNMTGGLIQATNSTFRNNKRSVEFRVYNHPEKSYFSGCNFIISGAVAGNTSHYSTAMVTAENINGTLFKACTFECTNPALPIIPKGIYTYNARFRVLPGTTSQTYPPPASSLLPNQFKGLLSGIEALNGTVNNFTVDTAWFQNCGTGILASNTKQYEVLRSRFSLSAQPVFGNSAKGLYNVGGTGFKVEENVFLGPLPVNGAHNLWGVVMSAVGGTHNEVYNNRYTGLNTANLALGANWVNKRPELGLKYKCNVQNSDSRDISVGLGANIGTKQGTVFLDPFTQVPVYTPAGNTFSLSPLATGHIQNLGSQTVEYVHHNQSGSGYNVEPVYISNGVVKIQATQPLVDRNAFCPSKLPSTVLLQRKPQAQGIFSAEKAAYDNVRYIYDNLLDGGNTSQLQQMVEYAWGQDVWDVRTELLGGSPFLTEEVLYSVAANSAIPQAVQLEVFMANPQCAKNLAFMEHLGTKPDPMPQWMIDLLAGQADAKTLRDELENQLAGHGSLWGYAANEILKALHEDSTGTSVDSLLLWQRRKSDRLAVVDLYAGLQEYTLASTLLDSLIDSDSLAGFDVEELAARQGLYLLMANYKDNGFPYWNIPEGDRQALLTFAQSGQGYAHREARNILRFYYGYEFEEPIVPGEPKTVGVKASALSKPSASQTLKVYPNPSRGQVIFEYRYPANFVDLYVEVHTATGVLMEKLRLTSTEGIYVWDCQNCASGSYIYKIVSQGRTLDSGTLQINR